MLRSGNSSLHCLVRMDNLRKAHSQGAESRAVSTAAAGGIQVADPDPDPDPDRLSMRSDPYPATPATSSTECRSTLAPAAAHSGLISSASLCDSPSTQGHMIITVGATLFTQQAS